MRILHFFRGWVGRGAGQEGWAPLWELPVESHTRTEDLGQKGTKAGLDFTLPVLPSRGRVRDWGWSLNVPYCVSLFKEGSGLKEPGGLEIHRIYGLSRWEPISRATGLSLTGSV